MKSLMCMLVAGAAATLVGQESASAQCGYGGGFGYGGYGGGISYVTPRYGVGFQSYSYPRTSFSVGFNSFPSYRTSYRSSFIGNPRRGHYDYHPPSLVPHGNHLHVVPGHYHWHRGRH